jgi:hypothetical protein
MEIVPITGIRALSIKRPSPGLGLPAVFDIENYARIHDERYSPNSERSGSGIEDELDDADELDRLNELDDLDDAAKCNDAESPVYVAKSGAVSHLSFFV